MDILNLPERPADVLLFVAAHLLTQGRKATGGGGSCFYRSPHGDMCAVGCLITDEQYDPSLEHKPLHHVLWRLGQRLTEEFRHYDLLRQLQVLHDESRADFDGRVDFRESLLAMAGVNGCFKEMQALIAEKYHA